MRLSALEQVPLFADSTPREAIEDMVTLAQGLEDLNFHRFWIAEHHNTAAFLSSVPQLIMTHLLTKTSRIRIGSGGVMAMHQGSAQIGEMFNTMATLHPNRVDMGLGRAPGGDMISAHALNQGRVVDPQVINVLIDEAVAIIEHTLGDDHPYAKIRAYPEPEVAAEKWLLGSSGQSAAWAGVRGMNYAYAQFFSGKQQPEIMDHYRAHLPAEPLPLGPGAPKRGATGQTLSALCVSAAATESEAIDQALPGAYFRLCLRLGRPSEFKAPELMSEAEKDEARKWLERDTAIIVGDYDRVADLIRGFVKGHRVDEVMLISYIGDTAVKLKQYAELAARLSD
ncbi:MsnO8 family LLM class oxidoreductase [Schaalia vaccimaxillae]|uniref:MsnO8 family LLM class oxidoreductase n=1 Tax=Schaalia vaccimaxillae TaxID=183916 RepID=UPI0003B6FEFC|nr:MsnO8 family LLM class oxidoreductase [Schaalia vaccimaxillae]